MMLKEAIAAYREKFGEGPPIWGMEDDEALEKIVCALESGKPMEDDEDDLPEGIFL